MSYPNKSTYPAHYNIDKFLAGLDYLRLTQAEFARLIGLNDRTVRRWMNGETEPPLIAIELLMAWAKLKDANIEWRRRHEPF